jgi:hypothetical protein
LVLAAQRKQLAEHEATLAPTPSFQLSHLLVAVVAVLEVLEFRMAFPVEAAAVRVMEEPAAQEHLGKETMVAINPAAQFMAALVVVAQAQQVLLQQQAPGQMAVTVLLLQYLAHLSPTQVVVVVAVFLLLAVVAAQVAVVLVVVAQQLALLEQLTQAAAVVAVALAVHLKEMAAQVARAS